MGSELNRRPVQPSQNGAHLWKGREQQRRGEPRRRRTPDELLGRSFIINARLFDY